MTHGLDAAVVVRAIVPSDAVNYRGILQRTSAEDRYCRFFHCIDRFTDEEIERYIEPRADAIGLIALKHGRPLGTVHAFFVDERCAELAIVVADDARRLGVGRLLLDEIRPALRRRGCTSIIAYALPQNSAFSNLARSAGMRPVSSEGGIISWSCALDAAMNSVTAEQRPPVRTPRHTKHYPTALVDASLFGCCNLLEFQHELLAAMLAARRPAASLTASAVDQAVAIAADCATRLLRVSPYGNPSAAAQMPRPPGRPERPAAKGTSRRVPALKSVQRST